MKWGQDLETELKPDLWLQRMRPDFEMKVRKRKVNPITNALEPYIPWYQKMPRQCISFGVAIFFVSTCLCKKRRTARIMIIILMKKIKIKY